MRGKIYAILVVAMSMTILTSCKEYGLEKEMHENSLIGIKNENQWARDGYTNSYYYNIDGKKKITIEATLEYKGEVIDSKIISGEKLDHGDIDGTFGIDIREKDDKVIYAIRLDEEVVEVESENFLPDVTGTTGSVVSRLSIAKEGNTVRFFKYDTEDNGEENYEWVLKINFKGEDVES